MGSMQYLIGHNRKVQIETLCVQTYKYGVIDVFMCRGARMQYVKANAVKQNYFRDFKNICCRKFSHCTTFSQIIKLKQINKQTRTHVTISYQYWGAVS